MEDKLNRFIENTQGHFQEVSYKQAIYQCMDLVYEWVFCLDIPKATIQHQYAYEVWTKASDLTREYFDLLENTPDFVPKDGDIGVLKGGKAGHIVIALGGGNTRSFLRYEQNNPIGTHPAVNSGGYANILGFLRPKKVVTEGTPQWLVSFLSENNLNVNDESKIRSIFDKARRYDDEIRGLKEQVKSANETLADKSLEVSLLTDKITKTENERDEANEQLNQTRSERDKTTWEKEKLEIENKRLSETVSDLNDKVDRLSEHNDIYAYSWLERLRSVLIRR